ncbi:MULTISPECIES: hypothetical protein [Pasteurellaceae]|uniref:SMODS and SLOG-associating 2TM effector domain-containing protein n=1 Tax=Pasteurella atlantica TaxID=2827233 RepID=A0AAW8CIN5_9PAST|nr:hypothetical protein [Pasteurella atlantica]MBR0573365.1 hypothetical protein [Pasteurella atlantica]MDP8039827.1 hypothetical protein [Pasteurella atlantica]MDP8041844.1 hypothetical protein [Pasteurella atlantica]MDP8043911.1 hypothetical protein [Pasteurella atlantica]MDP8046085.1 hypothetical protein [Pasteurella atlantica]
MKKSTEVLEQRKKSLLFDIRRSQRYHQYRIRFFNFWERMTNFISIVLSSSAVYSYATTYPNLALILSFILTIFSALSLVIGFGNKARDHQSFLQTFSQLETDLLKNLLSDDLITEIETRMFAIDNKEPPTLIVLEQRCYNEQIIADGFDTDKHCVKIAWYQKLFEQYFDILSDRIK